jgi:subtilisin-like proprotein convertase family protein
LAPLCAVLVGAVAMAALAAPAGAKTKTKTYSSGNINVPIVDDPGAGAPGPFAISPIKVKGKGKIKDVNVGVRITHTRDRDLRIYLFRGETYVRLSGGNGGRGNDYGVGSADCNGQQTVFDGGAPTFIQFGDAPFAGSFKPEQSLGWLNGLKAKATWRLVVFDAEKGQAGTIHCWTMRIKRKVK